MCSSLNRCAHVPHWNLIVLLLSFMYLLVSVMNLEHNHQQIKFMQIYSSAITIIATMHSSKRLYMFVWPGCMAGGIWSRFECVNNHRAALSVY